MIVNIRGTTGSGKSTVVRRIMDGRRCKARYGVLGLRLPEAYEVFDASWAGPVFILGPYTPHPKAGMDWIESIDGSLSLIQKYLRLGSVVFEGYMISQTYGALGEFLVCPFRACTMPCG